MSRHSTLSVARNPEILDFWTPLSYRDLYIQTLYTKRMLKFRNSGFLDALSYGDLYIQTLYVKRI